MKTKLAPIENRLDNPRERIFLPEILDAVSKAKTKDEKISLINKFRNKNAEHNKLMIDFVQSLYHPDVVYDLPEGRPPFETNYPDYTLAPNTLLKALSFAKYFVKGQASYIEKVSKREHIFIQQLESLYLKDAELLLMVKDKKLTGYKGVNEKLFREAIPGILPEKEDNV